MNKTLKFRTYLIAPILSGQKTSTWRLFDDKNLTEGDVVDFLSKETLEKFAAARLTKVIEKPFRELSDEDKYGHASFMSEEEMYKWYTEHYHAEVGPETKVKIVWFELV